MANGEILTEGASSPGVFTSTVPLDISGAGPVLASVVAGVPGRRILVHSTTLDIVSAGVVKIGFTSPTIPVGAVFVPGAAGSKGLSAVSDVLLAIGDPLQIDIVCLAGVAYTGSVACTYRVI